MEEIMPDFSIIIKRVLYREGGYVNDPDDPGGETKYGITKLYYPDVDIKNLTREKASKIYFRDYWKPSKADRLDPSIRETYFDMVVNFGLSGAVKVLQRACNNRGAELLEDGKIGPKTINAARGLEPDRLRSFRVLKFAKIVIRNNSQMKYWYGWYRRALIT